MIAQKPFLVPIPGTRKAARLVENFGAVNISLTADEMAEINALLDALPQSTAYAGRR